MEDSEFRKFRAAAILFVFVTAYSYLVTAQFHWMHPIEGWSLFFGGFGISFGLISDKIINSAALRKSKKICYFWYFTALGVLAGAVVTFISVGVSKGAASGHQWAVALTVALGIISFAVVIAAPFGNYKCWDERRHKGQVGKSPGGRSKPIRK